MTRAHRYVLVIEDDIETARQIVDFLQRHRYETDLAADGNEGQRLAESGEYAVMMIDRVLPGMDGLTIIRRLREAGIATPALIVSAPRKVDDRVLGLRAGGDDYLIKPFAFQNC
jgi:two-component system OmpR family response regulator